MNLRYLILLLSAISFSASAEESLYFIENKGQVTDQFYNPRPDISFILRSGNLNVFIVSGAVHYQFRHPIGETSPERRKHIESDRRLEMYRLDVSLVGSNKDAVVISEDRQQYYEKYFTQAFGDEGATAHSYRKITYKEIYPHIDWVLYIKDEKLEHEFVVREGGNLADIQLKYEGATSLHLNSNGSLTAVTPHGSITERAPYCLDGRGPVGSSYQLSGNIITFKIADYYGTLTIDPTVEWQQSFGGNGQDGGSGVTTDEQGNVYLSGFTQGGNIATIGAYQVTLSGTRDGFLMKLDDAGTKIWGTYFGGTGEEYASDIAYDNVGAVYIGGLTSSTSGIASAGAHQTSCICGGTAPAQYVAKFDLSGARLWATYYGGGSMEKWGDIACDNNGNLYLAGITSNTSLIATPGSHQPSIGGLGDAYLVKFNPLGVRQWGTYYGGSEVEGAHAVACDNNNNVYIGGWTNSTAGIATPGTFQTSPSLSIAAGYPGFLAKFDSNGVRQWGTYYCKAEVNGIACEAAGNVFIGGNTKDSAVATPGAYQTSFGGVGSHGHGDAFIAKMDATGNRVWGTLLGGSDDEYLERVYCDSLGFIYFMGYSKSASGVATSNAYQTTHSGNMFDGLFVKFSNSGMCMWSSYYHDGSSFDIAVENNNTFYMSGLGPGPSGDAYLVKFHDNSAGIEQIKSNETDIRIHPNPNSGTFTITGNWSTNEQMTIEIVDVMGRLVYINQFRRVSETISLKLNSAIPGGTYFVRITSSRGTASAKLILN